MERGLHGHSSDAVRRGVTAFVAIVTLRSALAAAGPMVVAEPGESTGAVGLERPSPGPRIVLLDPQRGEREELTDEFAAASWPDVSFDARKVLFVGRRQASDDDAVFELNLSSRTTRQIDLRAGRVHRAMYLPVLYTLDVDQPFEQIAVLATPHGEDVPAIFTCKPDGSRLTRITFSPTGVYHPFLLNDGRLLFSMGGPVRWFTVHTDGTDVFPFHERLADEPQRVARGSRAVELTARNPAGRSSVVDPASPWGRLYCMDVRTTDDAQPDALRAAATVRTIAQSAGGETVLGEAGIEQDGSFFLEAPARTPLRLELLDGGGHVVRKMKSWIWIMPGEDRGCIGCHEDRALTPPNRHVTALRKAPRRLDGAKTTGSEGR